MYFKLRKAEGKTFKKKAHPKALPTAALAPGHTEDTGFQGILGGTPSALFQQFSSDHSPEWLTDTVT